MNKNYLQSPQLCGDRIGLAKKALHTSIPADLPCRENEIEYVQQFLTTHILGKKGGSLYISGSPGTGKTAVVRHVLDKIQLENSENGKNLPYVPIFINCMNLGSPALVFELIGKELRFNCKPSEIKDKLRARVTSKSTKRVT